MSYIFTNWKTSIAGVGAALVSIGDMLNSLATGGGIPNADIMALIAAIGLLVAKDGNVSGAGAVQMSANQAMGKGAKMALATLALLFAFGSARAADVPPPVKAAVKQVYAPNTGGLYVGLGTYLETTQAQFTVGGVPITSNADTGSLGGIFGYSATIGQNWWGWEVGAYWQNLTNTGTVCALASACIKSNFSGSAFFEVGIPPGLNILPNVTSLFPGFSPGGAAANMYPYIGVGAHFDDVSGSLGAMNGRDWLIPFATRAGVKTKLTNGSVLDVWGDITFKGSGFAIGPGASVNQGNTYRAGSSFLFTAF